MPDTSRKHRTTTFAAAVGLQLLLLIATLGVAEIILRLVDLRELKDGYRPGSAIVHQYDADLGWSAIPNITASFTGSRTITVRNNSLGLRDIEPDHTNGPTVLFLGNSLVWGYDVEQDERFTELLREQLAGTRIINAGVVGYATDQEYLLLRRIWPLLRPSVVFLIFGVTTDRFDNTRNMSDEGHFKPYLQRDADGEWRFAGQPVPKSRQVYFSSNPLVRNVWLARAAVTGYIRLRRPAIKVPDPTERLFGMMREFIETNGARFLVGTYEHQALLDTFLQSQKIPHTSFDGAESYRLDVEGGHWTPNGHKIVADRIRSLLTSTGAIPTESLH